MDFGSRVSTKQGLYRVEMLSPLFSPLSLSLSYIPRLVLASAPVDEVVVHVHQIVDEGKRAGPRPSGGGDEVLECSIQINDRLKIFVLHSQLGWWVI